MDPLADPLTEFAYAAEAYDAVIIAALAAEAAGTDGGDLADFIVAVTSGSVICFSFAECIDLLFRGEDIGYAGVSGPLIMNAQGENVGAVYSVVEFGADNRIDDSLTRLVELQGDTEVSPAVVTEPRRFGDGVLTIGSLLPISGQLFQYAPAQQSAIRLAVAMASAIRVPRSSGGRSLNASAIRFFMSVRVSAWSMICRIRSTRIARSSSARVPV
jgi:ABC-type branched-subunit amino acid transport system substrate-binding protein